MFQPERRTASLLYLGSLLGTLVSIFVLKWQIISFIFVVVQFGSLWWYMLSYLPVQMQNCVKRAAARLVK